MSYIQTRTVDPELSNLIAEALDAGLLKQGSEDARIAGIVAERGQNRLTREDHAVWESRILPVLAKPIAQQMAVNAIMRRGGRLGPVSRP